MLCCMMEFRLMEASRTTGLAYVFISSSCSFAEITFYSMCSLLLPLITSLILKQPKKKNMKLLQSLCQRLKNQKKAVEGVVTEGDTKVNMYDDYPEEYDE